MARLDDALQSEVREQALALGATYFGVANLEPVRAFVTAQGGDWLGDYRFGVSVGIVLSDASWRSSACEGGLGAQRGFWISSTASPSASRR